MAENGVEHDRREDEHRTFINLAVAIFLLVFAIAVVWILDMMLEQEKLQRCLQSGRRDCIEIPSGGARDPAPPRH